MPRTYNRFLFSIDDVPIYALLQHSLKSDTGGHKNYVNHHPLAKHAYLEIYNASRNKKAKQQAVTRDEIKRSRPL